MLHRSQADKSFWSVGYRDALQSRKILNFEKTGVDLSIAPVVEQVPPAAVWGTELTHSQIEPEEKPWVLVPIQAVWIERVSEVVQERSFEARHGVTFAVGVTRGIA